jgi:hypothetical protein
MFDRLLTDLRNKSSVEETLMKKNLHVFDIDADNLKSFTTTEKDFNRKVDRFPPITFRNVSNDILDENFN